MARFVSNFKNHTIVVRPTRVIENRVTLQPEIIHGKRIIFENHEFITDDEEIIKFLREHRRKGLDFTEDDGNRKKVVIVEETSRRTAGKAK